MTTPRTTKSYIDNFQLISETGVDPLWPDHTGERIYQSGIYRVRIRNMGGITARQSVSLFRHSRVIAASSDLGQIRSLRVWVAEHITH